MFKTSLLQKKLFYKDMLDMFQFRSTIETSLIWQWYCIKANTNLPLTYFVQHMKTIIISIFIMILRYLLQELFAMALRPSHLYGLKYEILFPLNWNRFNSLTVLKNHLENRYQIIVLADFGERYVDGIWLLWLFFTKYFSCTFIY